jgi:TetR/AcrR family transcriptional regulator, transcriptional repressor for nem operon
MRKRRATLAATLEAREAVAGLLNGTIDRTLADRRRRGCMLVNAAVELAAHDAELRCVVADELSKTDDLC